MKAYRGVDGKIRLFRPEMNMHRMNLTASRSGLPTFDGEEAIKCLSRLVSIDSEWVPHTEAASLYLRPTLIGIEPTLGVASSDSALLYTILSPVGAYFDNMGENAEKGVSLLADPQFVRAWPGGCGDRKMGSNYAPTIRVQKQATKLGLEQVLWLYGEDHQLTEVGTMNIFMYFINDLGGKRDIHLQLDSVTKNALKRQVLELTSYFHFNASSGQLYVSCDSASSGCISNYNNCQQRRCSTISGWVLVTIIADRGAHYHNFGFKYRKCVRPLIINFFKFYFYRT